MKPLEESATILRNSKAALQEDCPAYFGTRSPVWCANPVSQCTARCWQPTSTVCKSTSVSKKGLFCRHAQVQVLGMLQTFCDTREVSLAHLKDITSLGLSSWETGFIFIQWKILQDTHSDWSTLQPFLEDSVDQHPRSHSCFITAEEEIQEGVCKCRLMLCSTCTLCAEGWNLTKSVPKHSSRFYGSECLSSLMTADLLMSQQK